nr:MAG TPA: hypothetical protein [Herelleviridae sp.]
MRVMEVLVITKRKKTMEETKFKVGDVVKVKSLDWYNKHKGENGLVIVECNHPFTEEMKEFCGKYFCINDISENGIYFKGISDFVFYDWMIEDQEYELKEVNLSKEEVDIKDPKFFTKDFIPFSFWKESKVILPIYKVVLPDITFQPFQKVLVKDMASINDCFTVWSIDFYSYFDMESHKHRCLGGLWDHCVPYEGNEHLLGTREEETR